MIILFPFLLPHPPFFFETTEFIALHFTRALGTSLARSSLIMNGLFIVVAHMSDTFYDFTVSRAAHAKPGFTFLQ